jgi:hypothetical protein
LHPFCYRSVAIVGRAITIWEAIQKRSHEPIYKTYAKLEAKGLRATTKRGEIIKVQYCYRNIGTYPISPFKTCKHFS